VWTHTSVCHAGEHDIADMLCLQHEIEVGGKEASLAWLVDDRLSRLRLQLGDDLPAFFAADENAAARPLVADAGADPLASASAYWPAGR